MRIRRSKGQSLVESALILIAFMGMLIGMIDVGQLLFVRQSVADRTRMAARWGALNTYDPGAIRRVFLYGEATPANDQAPFLGLAPSAVVISNPGCPGPRCRVSVAVPEHGIVSFELVDDAPAPVAMAADAASKP
jgi:TadE-like protein